MTGIVSSLVDITLGMEPEETGLSNIIIKGTLLGLKRREIEEIIPEIVDFSELGDYIDLPVRTYSSGMRLRLAFGISTAVRPDIAIFDEVIGVGDIQFHAKAKQRLDRLIQDAKIVFICSHDMTLIAENCTRALWLEGGRLISDGPAAEIVHAYGNGLWGPSSPPRQAWWHERQKILAIGRSQRERRVSFLKATMSDLTRERQTVLIDASTLARWIGTPVGMLRVEHELVHAVISSNRGQPVFYDPRTHRYADFVPRWREAIFDWNAGIDTWGLDYAPPPRTGWRRLVPSRYPIVAHLARRRRLARSPMVAAAFEGLRQAILAIKPHKLPIRDAYGRLVDVIPVDEAVGNAVAFSPGDTLFVPASDWTSKDLSALKRQKDEIGFRLVVMCYDIIPITHRGFFLEKTADIFERHWQAMFAMADDVIVNAQAIREDVEAYCSRQGLRQPHIHVVPLGCEATQSQSPLPRALRLTASPCSSARSSRARITRCF